MHPVLIGTVLAAVVLVVSFAYRVRRARNAERRLWQATRQGEWTRAELDTLRVPDLVRGPATAA